MNINTIVGIWTKGKYIIQILFSQSLNLPLEWTHLDLEQMLSSGTSRLLVFPRQTRRLSDGRVDTGGNKWISDPPDPTPSQNLSVHHLVSWSDLSKFLINKAPGRLALRSRHRRSSERLLFFSFSFPLRWWSCWQTADISVLKAPASKIASCHDALQDRPARHDSHHGPDTAGT